MKVLVIGIDGLDPLMIERLGGRVPFLSQAASLAGGRMQSVFPPDSVPAWASIMTGLSEDEHGVFGHIDYLAQATPDDSGGFADRLRGRTFFDAASDAGLASCVVNPFLAYPPWHISGSMVSGPVGVPEAVLAAGTVSLDPPGSDGPILGGIEEFPGRRDIAGFIARTADDIESLTAYACGLLGDPRYDLGFVTFLQLDRVQHFLWRYADTRDGTHPRGNPHSGAIDDFYVQLDAACTRLVAASGAECCVVVSDHGHGRRCERVLNVNEILRRKGLVRTRGGDKPWRTRGYWIQRAKIAVLELAWRLSLEEAAFGLARRLPNKKALKTSSYLHSRSRNLAAASSIGGTNPYGGIDLNAAGVAEAGLDPADVRARIIECLSAVRLRDGRSPFVWIAPREDLFTGTLAADFPDVLFELLPEYGVGWDLYGDIEGANVMHRRISGGHKREGFMGGVGIEALPGAADARVTDVAPTVLALLGCEVPEAMRGRVLARRQTAEATRS